MIYRNKDYIYNSESGALIHARDKTRGGLVGGRKGSPCGSVDKSGFVYVQHYGKNVRICDVIWRVVYGRIPRGREVYYIDGKYNNNKLSNLSLRNKGKGRVWKIKRVGWGASKYLDNGKEKFIGIYTKKQEALDAIDNLG